MNGYVLSAAVAFVCVVLGVSWRVHRTQRGNVVVEIAAGLNLLAAGLLGVLTAVFLFGAFNNELDLPHEALLTWSAIMFCVASCVVWVLYGVPPGTVGAGKGLRLFIGHLLVLVGTIVHGSVTFYMPVLIWLGLLKQEAAAVLPWFFVFTLPAACVLWAIGLVMILLSGSGAEEKVEATT